MTRRKPKLLSSKIVHKNPWYCVRHDKLIWPDNSRGEYFVMELPDGIIMIAEQDQKLLLVEQHRYTLKTSSLEFCTGGLNKRETILHGAKRELQEETGYEAHRLRTIGSFEALNGITPHRMHVVVTDHLRQKKDDLEPSEYDLRVRWIPISKWRQCIQRGKIGDGPTLAAWTIYQAWKATKKDSP
ncbi:MAG: NUDIX hydrolase [Candidatus Uhrbacteria bacterium]|nr:NUDIX hydrolase [Candidatus Uhrbacteria bacterium]